MSPKPYTIGIGGPSCAGKSQLAAYLAEQLPAGETTILSLDAYYKDLSHVAPAERAGWNFDAPEALDWSLLMKHLRTLIEGRPIDKPAYDFATHARLSHGERVFPQSFLIVEGLLALSRKAVRVLYDLRVYVDASDDTCLARREARDVHERGRTRESVQAQYAATVRPMAARFVVPTRRFADLVVSGEKPVSLSAASVLGRIHAAVAQGVGRR